ncbi:rod shape-determining protein RodA [Parasegetibacter sp. NRK P23]|uniref:rod shape-determining protein RodA n=1 Tax=Parasegetibacter sp. NRK P23 TaxID=2942999 RepID=UPI002043C8E4|nr:rod shape-determining protein RodA [Parasegetibacter sp. NRK P23]MCM5529540.1 rod shape-determining protein RodA [Parasegetibacter sp. NRK P23]
MKNPGISKGVDWVVIWIYVFLVVIGIMSIFANEYRDGEDWVQGLLSFKTDYSKQFFYFGVSLVLATFILVTDSKFFTATANIFYAFGIFLMLLVFPFHTEVKGTESIIRFGGGFQLQPAELCKVFANLALAKYLSRVETDFTKTKSQLIAAAIALVPAILSIAQKETGLALVYFSFFLVMYREGLPITVLLIGSSLGILVVATLLLDPNTLAIALTILAVLAAYLMRRQIRRRKSLLVSIALIWLVAVGIQRFGVPFLFTKVFAKHQVERIFDLVGRENPYAANTPEEIAASLNKKKPEENYNVRQSKIAIGSGGWIGKGYLKGTQTRYDFVPEQRTDFIFCTIGEGFGFVGSVLFLGIYTFLLLRIVMIAERQRSTFSRVYAYGVASIFFAHIAINICMTIGLAPVIGIPLPFVSYGGTSLLSFSVLLFIMIRLDADRQMVLR